MASTHGINDSDTGKRNQEILPSESYKSDSTAEITNIRSRDTKEDKDKEWAAIGRLPTPTFERMRKGMLNVELPCQVDVTNLTLQDRKQLLESLLKFAEEDHERFLRRLRERIDRCVSLSFIVSSSRVNGACSFWKFSKKNLLLLNW